MPRPAPVNRSAAPVVRNFSGGRGVVDPTVAPSATGVAVSRTLRAAGLLGAMLVTVLALGGPVATRAAAADGPQMTARVLLQGHARLGSWLAIEVGLKNEGAPITGELRLQGGSQGGTRFSVPVDLPSPSDKRYTLYAQPPSFGQQIEVVLVAGSQTVARQK